MNKFPVANLNIFASRKIILGAGALLILGVTALLILQNPATGSSPRTVNAANVISVDALKLEMQDHYQVEDHYAGRFASSRDSALGFERGGLLAEVLVDEAVHVREGDVLARLDTRALIAEQRSIEARLSAAEARVEEAKARLGLADVTQERQRKLLEQGHIAAQRFDEARYERDAVAAALGGALAQLNQIDADLERVHVALDLSEIRAPFAGEISARFADEGTILAPGQAVLRLLEAGHGEVRVGVSESVASLLKVGDSARIGVDGRVHAARLIRLVGAVDVLTRTQMAVFQMEDAGIAKPGELARLHLTHRLNAKGFWVPTGALAQSQRGLWATYVLGEMPDGLFALERRPVELLHVETDRAFVRGTLEQDDLIVSSGLHRLVPGQTVRLRTQTATYRD